MRLRARLGLTVLATAAALVGAWALLSARQRDWRLDDALKEFAEAALASGAAERCEADPARFSIHAPPHAQAPPPPREGPPFPRGGPPADRPEPRRGRGPPPGRGPDGHPGPPPREERAPEGPDRPPPREPTGDEPGTHLWAYDESLASKNPSAPAFPDDLKETLAGGDGIAAGSWQGKAGAGRQVVLRTPHSDGPCAILLVRRLHSPDEGAATTFWIGALALSGGLLLAVFLAAGPVVRRLRRLEEHVDRTRASGWKDPVPVSGNDEVAALARAFEGAGAAVREHLSTVESRERTLRDFLANTTHDLMIPLTVLQGHLSALRDAAKEGRLPDESRVRDALEEAHYIGMLVHNLGALARLESGEVHVEQGRVDLSDVVRRAVSRHAPIARGRGVALDHATPEAQVEVAGDVTLLEQAVSNLVHNAVSYGDRGGHVAVVLEAPKEPAGTFRLRVLDDGPGMTEAEIAHATERHFRGEAARTRRPGGGGLGLSIAKDVLARHGFSLSLRPSSPHGLDVLVSGPLRPATILPAS